MAISLFQYEKLYKSKGARGFNSSMTAGMISSYRFGNVVTGFNSEFSNRVNELRLEKTRVADRLAEKLAENPNYTGMRNDGVRLAWKYEKADIQMGGKGSANWNKAQRKEILETGSVKGSEGHHDDNVADHPQEQADPDNIRFYKSREKHLQEGHDGKWQNSSEMPKQDKELMLKRTNFKRVIATELTGIAVTAAIGFGIGASIEVVATLAREGISIRTAKLALKNGVKAGLKCAVFAVGTYMLSRAISYTLTNVFGINAAWANLLSSPIISAVFASVEYVLLLKSGFTSIEALKRSAMHAAIRLAIWALSLIPYCGTILSIVANGIYTGVEIAISTKEATFIKTLEIKTIEWSKPSFVLV